jgi:fructose-1,6-bisphosphatase/inositol monophosphatase family enzyme
LLRQQHFPLRLWQPQKVAIKGNVADMEGKTSGTTEPSSFLERLGGLLRQTSKQEILPRFQRLANGDIASKSSKEDPTDIVTIADRSAEAFLTSQLPDLLPGSLVIGEEAVAADERLLDLLNGPDPVWLVDPLDGTRNFATGNGPFGPMAALVSHGTLLAAAIHLSLGDELFLAERGCGAFHNGKKLAANSSQSERPVGTVFSKFMPKDLAQDLERRREGHVRETPILCAAHQYTRLCRAQKDYDVYYRLMPWDHAPGALILREAGGVSRHPDGRDYQVSARREVLLTARSETVWQKVRADLFGG